MLSVLLAKVGTKSYRITSTYLEMNNYQLHYFFVSLLFIAESIPTLFFETQYTFSTQWIYIWVAQYTQYCMYELQKFIMYAIAG